MTIISGFDLSAGQQRGELPLSSARERLLPPDTARGGQWRARASFDEVKSRHNGGSGFILPPVLSEETSPRQTLSEDYSESNAVNLNEL